MDRKINVEPFITTERKNIEEGKTNLALLIKALSATISRYIYIEIAANKF